MLRGNARLILNSLSVSTICLLALASISAADSAESCIVSVRMIKGSERDTANVSNRLKVGTFLSDMKSQLQPLPFKRFDVIDSKEQKLAYGASGSFRVKSADQAMHHITVVPHSTEKRRVQLTVNWKNPRGEELLATKLRVVNQKCVVLGTDTSGDTSTIASIRVNCN